MPADPAKPLLHKAHPMRFFWLGAGFAALAVGFVGAFLPVLPTTPFVILAAFAFGKSSPALEAWLLRHRIFGPMIIDWRTHGAIAPRYKAIACAMMGTFLVIGLWRGISPPLQLAQIIGIAAGAGYVLTRPSGPRP